MVPALICLCFIPFSNLGAVILMLLLSSSPYEYTLLEKHYLIKDEPVRIDVACIVNNCYQTLPAEQASSSESRTGGYNGSGIICLCFIPFSNLGAVILMLLLSSPYENTLLENTT
jgi:hypothetical protein